MHTLISKITKYRDNQKNQYDYNHENGKYHVYVIREIPVEFRLNKRDAAYYNKEGHVKEERLKEYGESSAFHKYTLTAREFDAWFEKTDDNELFDPSKPATNQKPAEPIYTF